MERYKRKRIFAATPSRTLAFTADCQCSKRARTPAIPTKRIKVEPRVGVKPNIPKADSSHPATLGIEEDFSIPTMLSSGISITRIDPSVTLNARVRMMLTAVMVGDVLMIS
jgi:hypothetical protein